MKPPLFIYMQTGSEDPGNTDWPDPPYGDDGVTWAMERIHVTDTEYVRADHENPTGFVEDTYLRKLLERASEAITQIDAALTAADAGDKFPTPEAKR